MARLMAVSLTEAQVIAREKTVTRRMGWLHARVGEQLTLCRKVMGRKRGEPLVRLAQVEITAITREPLADITPAELLAEGFPDMTAQEFIAFFCASHRDCRPDSHVTRIQWRYLDAATDASEVA
jgi:hypothetical protein